MCDFIYINEHSLDEKNNFKKRTSDFINSSDFHLLRGTVKPKPVLPTFYSPFSQLCKALLKKNILICLKLFLTFALIARPCVTPNSFCEVFFCT